ncbi:enterochelin esterase [Streptomyces sp. NPDC057702]|uniref:enterochelin esterase n=1 Tax=unclassified Streptomyces TaxID=2593676 RepID=UPI0036BE63E1
MPRVSSPRVAELARRRAAGDERAATEAVAAFWDEVAQAGTPLVEPDPHGDPEHAVVTFVWRGTPTTRAVLALPNKVIDPREPERNLMDQLPGTDVWHWSIRMRRDWQATYALCVDEPPAPGTDAAAPRTPTGSAAATPAPAVGESAPVTDPPTSDAPGYLPWLRGQGRPDPRNPHTLPRRWGGAPMSVVRLPTAPDAAEWRPRAGVPRGTVTTHTVRATRLGNERRVWVYTPPGTRPGPPTEVADSASGLPVLVLFDGEMWQPELGVATLLDNLIADGLLPPLVALLPESLDGDTRWAELACDDRFVDFLTDDLLPWAAARWPLTADPTRTVLAGQSLGGLMATYAAVRAPHRFGNALAQSGSFWWPDGPAAQWLTSLVAATPAAPAHPVRCWLSAGEQEWVLLPANRRLPGVLRAQGYAAEYREFNGGHDYLWWRTELAAGLTALLGPERADLRERPDR